MEPEKKMNGAVVGLIIIIIILVLGGIYIWQSKIDTLPEDAAENQAVSPADEEELDVLEEDLDSVNTDIEANVIESVQ